MRVVCHELPTVVGIAQHPRLHPIVTLIQIITKAWDNVDEIVQLITSLLIDVTYTIDQLEKKQDKQTRKKKVKDISKRDAEICDFYVCADVVNQRDICAQYAPSVDAT